MKKYLVTGGMGFIGSSISNSLFNSGNKVSVFDNNFRGSIKRLDKHFDPQNIYLGDIRNLNQVINSSKNIDCLIHAAYINGTRFFYEKPDAVLEVAIKGMLNVIEACKINNIRELILISSSEVYQSPKKIPTPENIPLIIPDIKNNRYSYGGGKIACELMARHLGRSIFKKMIVVRPHNVYGPDMGNEHVIPEIIYNIIKNKKKNKIKIQGTGKETRSFIYIKDFISAFNKILHKGKHMETYNIGTLEEINIKFLVKLICNLLGKKIKIVPGKIRSGGTKRRCPNISKIKKLGFRQSVKINDGLLKMIDYYRGKN